MRACVDVPAMSGHAHIKTLDAYATYGNGTSAHDVMTIIAVFVGMALVVAVITAGIVLCNRRSYR